MDCFPYPVPFSIEIKKHIAFCLTSCHSPRCLEVSSGASEKGGPTVDTANLNNPHPPHGLMLSLGVFCL